MMSQRYECKYLIVGGGVSGLAFAGFLPLEMQAQTILVEAEKELGGYCRTIKRGEFTWDYSGHFFHFKNSRIRDRILRHMEKSRIIQVRKMSAVYHKGRYIDAPFQHNINQLELSEFENCIKDLASAGQDEKQKYETFADYIISQNGRSIVELFIRPYNEKLYRISINELDFHAMGRFFPVTKLRDVLRKIQGEKGEDYNSLFTYPLDGAEAYIRALESYLTEFIDISLEERLVSVDIKNCIAKTTKRAIQYEKLISTIPLPQLVASLGSHNENLFNLFRESDLISSNIVVVVNLGFDKPHTLPFHWIYVASSDIPFYRVGQYSAITDSSKASLYVEYSIKDRAGFQKEGLVDQTVEYLRDMGIIDQRHILLDAEIVIMDPAYVHIKRGTVDLVDRTLKCLKEHRIWSIGRYGQWTYCSIEDNILQAERLASEEGYLS